MLPDFHAPSHLPPVFDPERATRTLDELAKLAPDVVGDAGFHAILRATAGNSPFLARLMLKEWAFLAELLGQGPASCLAALNADALAAAQCETIDAAMRRLRAAKRRAALAIALADITGLFDLEAVTTALTHFADCCVKGALRFLLAEAHKGTASAEIAPEDLEDSSGLIALAMGKMGAFELNYSSDIDLVVFYDEERFSLMRAGEKRMAAIELVKGLLKLLTESTTEGYVFRVDLRLRPDAGATQIAISTVAAELYYEAMGQNWERAAWIKARQCAGDTTAGARFLETMQPFIWRKNLDYAAIQDIHSIKRQIHSHAGHGRVAVAGHNIKLGRGGIREIEFFAQTQQLILGGRDASLRGKSTLGTLAALHGRGHISSDAAQDMTDSYRFLRMVEHRLQMIEDQQTHTLPKTIEGLDHIARFAGFGDTVVFEETMRRKLTTVQAHYARLFEREAPLSTQTGNLVFTGVEEDPETVATLARMGFERPGDVSAVIRGWHHGRIRATRSARARELLTKLMPALLEALARTADPRAAFAHFDHFLSGLPAGVQVFSMLLANPRLLDLIAEIAGSAPKLAVYLGRHAGVLDALIDPDFLARTPSEKELRERFAGELARNPGYEAALDAARRFAKEEMFRIGVQVIQGLSDAEEAGPAYAAIAETVIGGLQDFVEHEMAAAHGKIPGGGLVVVAFGKLGGREMTAASDLDLVFIYTHAADATTSDGARPLAPSVYYARTAQRFIAGLTAMTAEGRLYEVDMRLRPSGNQGPVAVSFDTFLEYHRERSWTWERMALTRARVLSGHEELAKRVEAAITAFLTRPADAQEILRDARVMREKMAAQFPGRDIWDIKFAPGGLVDIEFIAQILQLCRAAAIPGVLDANTIAALEKLERAGALSAADAETLISAAR
ncbi:MAG TPA: bifunctional [glutamine synthetase] adenylyltransferase/[glutamine synthetase]-adenylyl-L-tyrosine phosphorylase, partial [Micropepsaceae bacterium]|nr:bifunctional [glutamine synthetase] adenylyltransferase/[glutamine synthetase]-adenylyl-L-tyrosine phosphorylase [Micropepsaceae bacterium]